MKYLTAAELATRLRADYAAATGLRAASLAAKILDLIGAGVLSDAQMRQAFGATAATWAQVKGRMQQLQTAQVLIAGARGE